MATQAPPERDHDEQERLNRQLLELLNELRVALPGVQVLFAFLLAVPFQQRFSQATSFQKYVYLLTLLASATTTALLIAPTGYHRLLFQRGDRPRIIEHGTRMLVAGLVCLAVAMTGAVYLITDFLFSTATAVAIGAAGAVVFGWLWFGQALARRWKNSL
jgi:Flp pilus assembly protein TadB